MGLEKIRGTITAAVPDALVVDLDHSLVRTDTLFEQFAGLVFRSPVTALLLLVSLIRGRARFKAQLAELHPLDASALPYHELLLAFLREQKAKGRTLHLVTASDRSTAEAVARHCGLFDTVEGSDGASNLKGARKAEHLVRRFPEGFAYAGDSRADLKVWNQAESIVLAGASPAVANRARKLGKMLEAEFEGAVAGLQTWRRALRVHQWAKNLLVFVPLLLSQKYLEPRAVGLSILAFVALSLVAAATYLINDLSDLAADRRHPTKRRRPLAAGDLRIEHALAAVPLLFLVGGGLAAAVSPSLLLGLLAYVVLTLGYTFYLKRQALLDVVTLGVLYALRLMIGAATIGVEHSVWLLTFSLFFFFSMSLAKRYAEIANLLSTGPDQDLKGRGYRTGDASTVLALGVSSSTASVLIVVLYLMEDAFPSNIYAQSYWLWTVPFVLTVWAARIWLIAGRGELDEDPVAFAIKDRFSLGLAAPLAAAFALATIRWP
jgi:4-hydroxybenzoate polyprenyltransferase